jgi:hypothetical protein
LALPNNQDKYKRSKAMETVLTKTNREACQFLYDIVEPHFRGIAPRKYKPLSEPNEQGHC